MNRVQLAVFPALLVSISSILLVTNLIAAPQVVLAANAPAVQPVTAQEPAAATPEVVALAAAAETSPPQTHPAEAIPAVSDSTQPETCSLSVLYPDSVRQWCGLIEQYSAQNGLEPGLVAALITQESGGDANAYSHSGAVGLMQVMPRDGLAASFMCPSGPCFASRPSTQELLDPEYNISYGTSMLAGLISRYGTVREALLHYGPINVGYYYADLVLGIFESKN